jgi:hypothetical protein
MESIIKLKNMNMNKYEHGSDRSGEVTKRFTELLKEYVDIGTIIETLKDEGYSLDEATTALKSEESKKFNFIVEKHGEAILHISQVDDKGGIILGFPKKISWKN